MSISRDIVLFLGAGFSKDAKLPIISDFGLSSRIEHDFLSKADMTKKPSVKTFLEAGDTFQQLQNFCSNVKKIIEIDQNNMEDVFCLVEALCESNVKEIKIDDTTYKLDYIRVQIGLWLWKIYQQCPFLDPRKDADVAPYMRFVNFLAEKKLGSRITVISTNYDLIFEYLAWRNKMMASYPLPTELYERLIVSKKGNSFINHANIDTSPIICKLHGSINYFNNLSIGKSEEKIKISDDIGEKGEYIGGSRINYDEGMFAVFYLDWWEAVKKKIEGNIVPAFIPPTYAKLEQRVWLRCIWFKAFEAIRKARAIFFIGYSFTQTDGFIKSFFQGAMAQRESKLPLEVYLLKPLDSKASGERLKDATFLRYKSIFHSGFSEKNFIDKAFAMASQDGDIENCLSELI